MSHNNNNNRDNEDVREHKQPSPVTGYADARELQRAGNEENHAEQQLAAEQASSSAALTKALSNITYPASREQIMAYLEDNNAAEVKGGDSQATIIRIVHSLPDRDYTSVSDVSAEIGRMNAEYNRTMGEANINRTSQTSQP